MGDRKRDIKSRWNKRLYNSNAFQVENKNGQKRYFRRDFPIEEILSSITDLKKGGGTDGQILKVTNKSRVMLIPLEKNLSLPSVCVKEYVTTQWSSKLKASMGYSKSRIAWNNANGLAFHSIPTATPLAFIEKKTGFFSRQDTIITEDLARFPRIDYYILNNFNNKSRKANNFREKRKFIKSLAKVIRAKHDKNVYIGDMKAPNILVEKLKDSWKFYFIDTDRITFGRTVSVRRMVKNFAQLHASIPICITRSDRLRFLLFYFQKDLLQKSEREIIRRILKESKKKLAVKITPIE